MVKTTLISITLFLCCVAVHAQAPAPVVPAPLSGVEDVYLAKDNGAGRAGDQATEFNTTDIPIYCVVLLDTGVKTVVKMNFVAVVVSGVKAETKVVTATYTTKESENRVNFSGRPEGKWTPGKYRVDLYLDGKQVKQVEFEIKGAPGNTSAAAKYFQPPAAARPKPVKRPVKVKFPQN